MRGTIREAEDGAIAALLGSLYPAEPAPELAQRVMDAIGIEETTAEPADPRDNWSADDVLLITYADALHADGEAPLRTLASFLEDNLRDAVSMVHVLPFFPSSSDGGFAVVDYLAVDHAFGSWSDVSRIGERFALMADLVLNHASADSAWFRQFLADEEPGCDYFVTAAPGADISQVVRPRTHPLLRPTETSAGERHVWCTFSHDQCDLDFRNPDVLIEFLRIIDAYLEAGVRVLRLDAVAYLWKRLGTPCIHLAETHLVIRLLRVLLARRSPEARLITETNVPNRENLTYFGNANEAHGIYNFSLPPLLLDALLRGSSVHLQTWMMSMPPAPQGATYLNFIASHDGIGLRPAEGILSDDEIAGLAQIVTERGGHVSEYAGPHGPRPYELNVSLFDALAGDELGVDRFVCAHAIILALEGIPGFYLHSLLATPCDHDAVARTGAPRSINRSRRGRDEVERAVADPDADAGRVFARLTELMALRRRQPAFHPNATQFTLSLGPSLFGFWRQSMDRSQSVFAVTNVTDTERGLELSALNLIATESWTDLISGALLDEIDGRLTLAPYATIWLTNQPG